MKQKLFNLFPTWLRNLPHSDKIVHAILGTLLYVILRIFMQNSFAFLGILILAIAVEVYDKISGKGTPDPKDIMATFAIPLFLLIAEEMIL